MEIEKTTFVKHKHLKAQPVSDIWKSGKQTLQFLFFDNIQHLTDFVDSNTDSKAIKFSLPEDSQNWCFGNYFKNKEKTKLHLVSGSCPEDLIDLYEDQKDKLYTENPELFDLSKMAKKKKRRRSFGEEGSELNIDRFMSGEVEMWERIKNENRKPSVKLNISAAISAQTNNENLVKNFCAAVAFIDILSSAGINCEVYYSSLSIAPTNRITASGTFAKIKESNSPVDLSRLLSCAAPGLQRFYDFRVMDFALLGTLGAYCGYPANDEMTREISALHDFDLSLHAGGHISSNLKFITEKLKEILS